MNIDSILKRWFVDYLNPTHKELKSWMEDSDSFEPMQDWDLIVGNYIRLPSLVRLANNAGPQRDYIVHCLHVSTAAAFSFDRSQISEGIKLVPESTFSDLLKWRQKAEYLLESPASFSENEWFDYRYNK